MDSPVFQEQSPVEPVRRSRRRSRPQHVAPGNAPTTSLQRGYETGILFIAISAAAWSTAGLFVRSLPLDAWTLLFWRSLFAAGFLAVHLFAVRPKPSCGPILRMAGPDIAVAAFLAVSMLAFIPALQLTSVANVAVIFATTPVLTAVFARLWLGEVLHRTALLAGVTILAGTCVLVWGSGFGSDLVGNALAIVMTLTMAAVTLFIRRYREQSLLSSICLANILVALASLCFAVPLLASWREMCCLALFGLVQVALAFVFFSAGTRRVSAAQVSLIGALETPLAPFWVWLAFGEVPSLPTLFGGCIITAATVGHLVTIAIRSARRDV
ncbi:DMT family transporter [Mesorhizobium sp. M00.F.Ca.ET.216.01.1.1]|uniref:DMT family transporter n=1 Tax=Mesorhizobium sp. M00.F.Ca.ET.216.01.1.1 TaxID=2500528 RepID=UPI000FD83C23|nr:DMT family transporter [Mesorhizobium sp. M00.F.Ca.ET.216.01.1.1]TGQ29437.1 DMT family transporter [Mesorhizobium sp. M00.F.Ca.ET.216.01.1.1]TJW07015.1 MAG: DMT family transporter [Mesorhizobium sp.]TJW40006.1 MAG: DMT family transporter [Mesorhizobium sp.]